MVFELIKVLTLWTVIISIIVYLSNTITNYFLSIGYTKSEMGSSIVFTLAIMLSYSLLVKKK